MDFLQMNKNTIESNLVNLASPKLGSKGYKANDEFFAPLQRMLSDNDPVFIEGKYDNHGKWMDGWETRRRRGPGFDWSIIKLGCPGIIKKVDFDTSFFTGNFPPESSLEGCFSSSPPSCDDNKWETIIHKTKINGNQQNLFKSKNNKVFNWIKLNIFPDGGIARLRLWGDVYVDWSNYQRNKKTELSLLNNGGKIILFNNAHYGDVTSLISKGIGKNMGDGWETRRRRTPGNDWIIIKLCNKSIINEIHVDTSFFKGNFPHQCSVDGFFTNKKNINFSKDKMIKWLPLVSKQKLKADSIHTFKTKNINSHKQISHVRLNIFPDGGVSRFRVFGLIK